MIWHLLRYLVTFSLPVFYKRIQGRNTHHITNEGPVIIAMNHPNAFTDPIAISFVTYPVRVRYLARGDAFKPGLISFLLEQIGIVPIFRIQDGGREGLKKNDEAFRRVNHLLQRNRKIIVFAEGLCIQERRLRPIKKGVARMVFGGYEFLKNDKLMVVPVGVNYSQPDKFRSTIFYNVGDPIPVKDFIAEYHDNEARTQNKFVKLLESKMKALITHINNKEYDDLVLHLEELMTAKMLSEKEMNSGDLWHRHQITHEITERVNKAEVENKPLVDELAKDCREYFRSLRKAGLRDWLIDPVRNKRVTTSHLYLRYFLIALGAPIHLMGLIGNYLPYSLTKNLTRNILKGNKEFYSSIAIGLGMFLLLFNYIAWFILVYSFSDALIYPLAFLLFISFCSWFSLYFHFFVLKTKGMARYLRNPALASSLSKKREELLNIFNKI